MKKSNEVHEPQARLTLRWKLVLGFTISFSILLSVFGFLILHNNGTRYRNQIYAYCRKIVEANISLLDTYFEHLSNMTKIIVSDRDIIYAVNYREKTDDIDYSIELYNQRKVAEKMLQFDVLGHVKNAIIIGSNGEYLYYSDKSPRIGYNFAKQDWFTKATPAYAPTFMNYHPTDYILSGDGKETVSVISPIMNMNSYFSGKSSYLLMDFSLTPILASFEGTGETELAIYAGTERVYFPPETGITDSQMAAINEKLENEENSFVIPKGKDGKHSFLIVAEKSTVSGWTMLGLHPMDSLDALMNTNKAFVYILAFVSFALILILSTQLTKSLLIPMNKLLAKFKRIGEGEKDITFEKTGSIEVNRIAETAEKMLRKSDELSQALIVESQERAKATIRSLQHQINPHFLNNVLQSMKALAVSGDTESVSKMATLLGKMLTYSVYDPYDSVTLGEEFEYTATYVALQNVRFSGRIVYIQTLSEEVKDIRMPKLILQPLVENAIVHGLDTSIGGEINISADLDEDTVVIAVTNNGSVITPEKLKELNELLENGSADERKSSIGLLNVKARLREYYGENANLELMSRNGMNTSAIMTIPLKEGETDAESIVG